MATFWVSLLTYTSISIFLLDPGAGMKILDPGLTIPDPQHYKELNIFRLVVPVIKV
jgi:hypothetical protein